MATLRSARRSFNPEALSQIAVIVDDVWKELAAESAFSPSLSSVPHAALWPGKFSSLHRHSGTPLRSRNCC
jgi:hypothetical protein